MRKRLLIIIFILLLMILYCYNNKSIDKNILKDEEDYSSLPMAVMVETNYNTNKYETWLENDWPSDDYVFNNEKSGCENGGSLEWNKDTRTMRMKANTSDKCYAYFDSPLKIYTIEDLVDFSSNVNSGTTYAGKTVLLMNDLDFNDAKSYESKTVNQNLITGSGFTPIGNNSNSFQGIFDGNNKTISNLYIDNKVSNTFSGFFWNVSNGTIKNVSLNGSINLENQNRGGALVGNAKNTVNIYNCHTDVNMTNTSNAVLGGLIGQAEINSNVNIDYSSNLGNVTGGSSPGGLVGYVSQNTTLTINNSYNEGIITSNVSTRVGGLVGRDNDVDNSSTIIIKDSYNLGNIISEYNGTIYIAAGGLVGKIRGTLNVDNSYNKGIIQVSAESEKNMYVGGILGINESGGNVTINESYNLNNINYVSAKTTYENDYSIFSGGIIGGINNSGIAKISNSYNKGSITNGNSVGGIVGEVNSKGLVILDKCYNMGSINASFLAGSRTIDAGGLIGYSDGGESYIINSYNDGEVTNNQYSEVKNYQFSSGIIGQIANVNARAIIINSYNKGKIMSKSTNGFANGLTLYNVSADKRGCREIK